MLQYTVTGPIPFVEHHKTGRSGHLGHALVEYKPGFLLAFTSNCSGTRNKWAPGHNGFGWLETHRSTDGGRTWEAPRVLDYSMHCLLDENFTVSCEKAVSPGENVIVALLLRNVNPNGWEPYFTPFVIRSEDAGETWSEPIELCPYKGRPYDMMMIGKEIYVLHSAAEDWPMKEGDSYQLYVSSDGGHSFALRSTLPDSFADHGYGSLVQREDGSLLAYTYNTKDEFHLDVYISHDLGMTWPEHEKSFCARRIRNPQVARVRGGYILHGRSGCMSKDLPMQFVLYTSPDGLHWDGGTLLCDLEGPCAYYSNNIVLDEPNGVQRVLIQSSVPYDKGRVDIAHWFLDIQ